MYDEIGIDISDIKEPFIFILYDQFVQDGELVARPVSITDVSKDAYRHLLYLRSVSSILGRVEVVQGMKTYIINNAQEFLATITA